MADYKRILVVITPHREEQPALERAVFLAKQYNAELILGCSMYNRSIEKASEITNQSIEQLKQTLIDDQKQVMTRLVNTLGLSTETKSIVTWHKKWYKGVIDIAIGSDCDLIIKETSHYKKTVRNLFTTDHWNLLRCSPINVLMVKNHQWTNSGNIVSAISLDDGDSQHKCLSKSVATEGHQMANMFNANLHFVNTISKAPLHIAVEKSDFDPEKINRRLQQKHTEDLVQLASQINAENVNVIVEEGLPGKVVPKICENLNTQCLILGSVGRKGIDTALLGNTAEYIIDKLDCDTLVVKT
jgi:universal stress protein E